MLKAKEKVVDLEINGEPVEIQMKLDDTGAAFFVEEVAGTEEVGSPELATSPIPDQSGGKHSPDILAAVNNQCSSTCLCLRFPVEKRQGCRIIQATQAGLGGGGRG